MVSKRKVRVKTVGAQIDAVFKYREKCAALTKKAEDAKKILNEMKLELIETMKKQKVEGSRGTLASVAIKTEVYAQPMDWEAIHEFIYENRAAHMYYSRIKDTAFREMLELRGGEAIPGIEAFEKETLSITRRTT